MAFIKQIKVGNNTYDIHKKVTVTIAAADWTAATIDKTVSGMTVNDVVVVSPAPSSITGARNSVVYCSAIKANALSFTYSVSKPATNLTFTILWVQAATTDTDKGAIINTVMGGKVPTGTLNVNSTLHNYDTYLNNVRYINLGAGSLNVSGSAISSVSGSGSVNPGANTISKNSATNVSTGTVTTTKPTSGVYVAVDATTAQGSGNVNISASGTAKAGVTTAGYVHNETASSTISKSGTASVTVPPKPAATTYIPINAGTIDVTDKTVNPNALTGSWDATNEKYVVSQAKKTGETMQSTVTTAGYVSSTVGTKNTGALTINAPANLEIAKATFTVSGNSVKSDEAGYIPANTAVGAVSTVARAKTTTSTTANTTDAKLTVTASNNQATGYVTGSNETASDTITLSVSGATVTATSGNDNTKKVSKSVASGTAGTPTATKGTVSNHSIAVTPSVTNTTGYIAGGTKSGTAVTVAASELVSENRALSSSASDQTNIDVTNYKTVSISKMNSTHVVEKAGSVNTTNNTYTQGKVTVDTAGYISAGDKVLGASFANTATTNVTYKDISSTTAAPILVSNDYLYINKGYTDNVKISLAKLVPDGASADLASNKILSGYSAYDNDGKLIAGNIPTITPAFDGGDLSGNNIGGSQTKGSVTISESGTFFADAAKTNFGVTTTKPTSGTDGTNYLTVHETHSAASDTATGSTTITRGAVLYNGAVNGYVSKADNTQALASGSKAVSASITVTPSVTDNFEPYYIPVVTPAFDGGTLSAANSTTDTGALSGGALTAGAGEVSITTAPVVTPSISGTAVSSTSQTNFGVTTTKPSGTDGTNYITIDPSGSVTTTGKTKGRGSVTRGTINRAEFSSTVTRGAVLYNGAQHGAINIADNAQALASGSTTVSLAAGSIASTSGTSNWSAESNITPTIAAGTNYYIPVSTASANATAGFATATAGTTSTSGLTAGTYQTTATSGYTYSITATGGSASATGGSASASVSKGVTAGATKSASGVDTGTKTGSSSTIYLVKATPSTTNGSANATANAGTASVTTNPSASASATQTGMADGVSTTATSYYFTSSASANAGKLTATGGSARAYVTASSAKITKGYAAADTTTSTTASDTGTKTGNTVTTDTKTASDSSTVYLKAATCSVTRDSAPSATIAKDPTATTTASSATASVTGMKTTTTNTGYVVSASATSGSASAASGYSTASVGAIYDTHTAGYLPNKAKTEIFNAASATATEKTAHSDAKTASETKYIQKGVLGATVSGNITFTPSVSTNMSTISKPSSGTEGTDYFSITGSGTKSGTVTGKASVTTEGYVKSETATGGSATGTVGSNAVKYVQKAAITNNTSGGTSSGTINRGSQIKIGAGYNPTDLYYTAQAAPTLSGDAAAANVLSGKTFYSNSYTRHTGSMVNCGAVNPTALNPGGSYTVPAGYHNGSGKVTARALNNQAKSPTEITVGTAITPDSGRDGLSSVTIPNNATITVSETNKLNIAIPHTSSPVVTYTSAENEGGTSTQLNATVGGASANTINIQNMATVTANLSSVNSALKINRTAGTVTSDDLIASNIRKGSSILGVSGTYAAGSTASDIYRANYAGNVASVWSTYWESYEGNMHSDWEFTENLATPIPQGARVRLVYNEFGPNANSGAGFKVYLVSASGTTQLIASPSAYTAANGPHTSLEITANFVATKIKVEKSSAAGETVYTYQLLAVETYINVPTGYYGIATTSNGTTLADISSYQFLAVKKATLGNTYTPSTSTQNVYAKGEGWVKASDSIATISAIPTETKSVALSMASSNQTINATSGKYMTSVTVTKPSTLIASNIKSGVNIAGVVGTYEGGSSTSTFPIYIRNEEGVLLHTLNISQVDWGIKWGEYIATHGPITFTPSGSSEGYSLSVGGESDPATSNNGVLETQRGWYLYSGSGIREIGITGLMVMGPGDYSLK